MALHLIFAISGRSMQAPSRKVGKRESSFVQGNHVYLEKRQRVARKMEENFVEQCFDIEVVENNDDYHNYYSTEADKTKQFLEEATKEDAHYIGMAYYLLLEVKTSMQTATNIEDIVDKAGLMLQTRNKIDFLSRTMWYHAQRYMDITFSNENPGVTLQKDNAHERNPEVIAEEVFETHGRKRAFDAFDEHYGQYSTAEVSVKNLCKTCKK